MSEKKITFRMFVFHGTELKVTPITLDIWNSISFRQQCLFISIYKNLNELELKEYLRDIGVISNQPQAYNNSRIFFSKSFGEELIELSTSNSTDSGTLEDLPTSDDPILVVFSAKESNQYEFWSNMRCF